jgi:hypothetical protein
MSKQQKTSGREATIYRIQARGTLDESWSDSVGGMDIVIKQDDDEIITSLTGKLPDQAALSGVLNLLYDLGLTLLSVESLDDPASVEGLVNTN